MKTRIYSSFIILLISVLFTRCSKDLELSPISNANELDFYKTPKDIDNAVIAAYKFHKQIYTNNFSVQSVLDEIRSDNTTMVQLDVLDRFVKDTGKEWYGWSWDGCYRAIFMCNLAMEKAATVEMDASLMNQYIGEARFLRALLYFELVRNFGAVPLVVTTPTTFDPESTQIPRDASAAVYTQIVDDLTFASQNLPAQYTGNNIGRATSGAANGMLGKVYLTMGDKPKAEAALRAVVNSGLYELMDTYAEVWDISNENNAESLFELQFKPVTDGSPMQNLFSSIAAPGIPGGGLGYNLATSDLVEEFEAGDLRKDITMTDDPNGVYYTIKYNDPSMTAGNNSGHNFYILRYADVLLMLAEATGENAESYGYINELRDRAGLGDISAASPGTFEEKLLHERRVELAFENHRWHDLLRFGVAIPVINAHFQNIGLAITIGEDDLLMPIPQTAISTNPNLDQNPGYN